MLPRLLKSVPEYKLEKARPFLQHVSLEAPKKLEETKDQKLVGFALELVKAV